MSQTIKDRYLAVLFFLFTIYSASFVALIKLANNLNLNKRVTEITYFDSILGLVLVGVALIIGLNWIIVVISGVIELQSVLDARKTKRKDVVTFFRKQVLNTPWNIILNYFSMFYLLYLVLISFILYWVALIILAIIFGLFFFFKNQIEKNEKIIGEINNDSYKFNWKGKGFVLLIILWLIGIGLIVFSGILHSSVGFEVKFDKDYYNLNDTAMVQIYPKGIIKPLILNVTYSSSKLPVQYIQHEDFKSSPVYVIISPLNLTDKPYNSYITISYKVPRTLSFYKYLQKIELLPVFPNQAQEYNLSIISKNDTISINEINLNVSTNLTNSSNLSSKVTIS